MKDGCGRDKLEQELTRKASIRLDRAIRGMMLSSVQITWCEY
jgi:hypothetical protein